MARKRIQPNKAFLSHLDCMIQLQGLPQEIMMMTFSYCIIKTDYPYRQLAKLEITCKFFKNAMFSSALWRIVYTNVFSSTSITDLNSKYWKTQLEHKIKFRRRSQQRLDALEFDSEIEADDYIYITKRLRKFIHVQGDRCVSYQFKTWGVAKAIIQCVLSAQQDYISAEVSIHQDYYNLYASDPGHGYILQFTILNSGEVDLEAFSPYNAVEELDTLSRSLYEFPYEEKDIPLSLACRFYLHFRWLFATLDFKVEHSTLHHPPTKLHFSTRGSLHTLMVSKATFEDNISILNDDYSGHWYGYDSYNDIDSSKKLGHRKLDEMLIYMRLQFVPSQELPVLVNFSGTGTDRYVIFHITDGIWSTNGCIQFHKDYSPVVNLKLTNILQQKLVDSDQDTLPRVYRLEDLYDEEDEDDYQDENPGGLRCYGRVLPVGIFGICAANDGGKYKEGAFWMWRASEQPNGIGEWR